MTISIALCTYNGERFLQEQLDSIAAQTRLPDELVACDDGSTDKTVALLETFVQTAPFSVRIVVNTVNLGSTQNFAQAIGLCCHELIFLCDQDDVWRADKLEIMHTAFAAHPETGLVFSDADVVDEHLKPLGRRLWQSARFGPKQQRRMQQGRAFDVLYDYNVVTGATAAFRAQFRQRVLPIPKGIALIHDGWIALIISAYAPLLFLPEPLIQYRQHPAQQMGVVLTGGDPRAQILSLNHYEAHIRQLEALTAMLISGKPMGAVLTATDRTAQPLRFISKHQDHIRWRLALPPQMWRRTLPVATELMAGHYHRYSNGWRSAVRDFLHGHG